MTLNKNKIFTFKEIQQKLFLLSLGKLNLQKVSNKEKKTT